MTTKQKKRGMGALNRIVENDFIHRVSADEYLEKVKDVYGGRQGALLATCSHLSMHVPLGRRLFRTRKFDLRGMKSILDVGSGAGQIAGHLLDFADPEARITCIDISQPMLRRGRQRLKSERPDYVVAGVTSPPFADDLFCGINFGDVVENVARSGLRVSGVARVLR